MKIIIIIKDIAHINFTLPYLQPYLLFGCIAETRFCLFPGGKSSSSLTGLDNILWSKKLSLERTVYLINLSK